MSGFVHSPKPIELVAGDGAWLYDADGQAYLDAGASYGCAPIGHAHPAVVAAISDQASSLVFAQASYPTPVRTALFERLASVAPGDCTNAWLCNSGTEANEAALKFARSATGRDRIVAATRGFHGRTMGSLSATWKRSHREPFEPLVPEVTFVPFGDETALAEAVDDETAAVILEPLQGEGGINVPPAGYLAAARTLTEAAGAALILDEIQTGLGRTGTFWACEAEDVVPDILTSAKGLGSGLPIGVTLCRDWIAEGAGPHGSTFSGAPIPVAAALATLDTIQADGLAGAATDRGGALIDALDGIDACAVRGRGLLIGVDVRRGAGAVARSLALDHQVLVMTAGRSVIRLVPPLTVDDRDIEHLAEAVATAVESESGT